MMVEGQVLHHEGVRHTGGERPVGDGEHDVDLVPSSPGGEREPGPEVHRSREGPDGGGPHPGLGLDLVGQGHTRRVQHVDVVVAGRGGGQAAQHPAEHRLVSAEPRTEGGGIDEDAHAQPPPPSAGRTSGVAPSPWPLVDAAANGSMTSGSAVASVSAAASRPPMP